MTAKLKILFKTGIYETWMIFHFTVIQHYLFHWTANESVILEVRQYEHTQGTVTDNRSLPYSLKNKEQPQMEDCIQYTRTFTGGVIPSPKKTTLLLQIHFPPQE